MREGGLVCLCGWWVIWISVWETFHSFCLLLGFTTCVSVLNLTLTLSFPNWTQCACVRVIVCACTCASVCLQFSRTDRSANFIFYDNGKNDMIRRGILPTIHVCFLPECWCFRMWLTRTISPTDTRVSVFLFRSINLLHFIVDAVTQSNLKSVSTHLKWQDSVLF